MLMMLHCGDNVSSVHLKKMFILWKLNCCTADHVSSVYDSESVNALSPNFHLDVDHLLQDVIECDHDEEITQVSSFGHSTRCRLLCHYLDSGTAFFGECGFKKAKKSMVRAGGIWVK